MSLVLDDGPLTFQKDGLDLAVRVGLPSEVSLSAQKLSDNQVSLAATRGLSRKHGKPAHPRELANYPTVAHAGADGDIVSLCYLDGKSVESVRVQPLVCVNEGNSLLELVRDGIGVGYLSRFAAEDDLKKGRLVEVLPEFELQPYDPVYVITPGREFLATRVAALRQALLDVARV